MGKRLRGASGSETGNSAPVFGNYTGNKENTSIGQKKHWKSQEVASYSPAYFIFLFFFMHQAMFIDHYDYHSNPFTFSCIFMCYCSESWIASTQSYSIVLRVCICAEYHLSTIHIAVLLSQTPVYLQNKNLDAARKCLHTNNMTWTSYDLIFKSLHHTDISQRSYCTWHNTFGFIKRKDLSACEWANRSSKKHYKLKVEFN